MTAQTKATLKARFTSGTEVSAADFGDLIDSFINLAESSAQTVASPVVFNETVTFTTASGTRLQASTLTTSGMVVTGTASATTATPRFANVSASSVNTTILSAATGAFEEVKVQGVQVGGTRSFYSVATGRDSDGSTWSVTTSATAAFCELSASCLPNTQSLQGGNFSSLAFGGLKYKGTQPGLFLSTLSVVMRSGGAGPQIEGFRIGKKNADGSAVTYPVSETRAYSNSANHWKNCHTQMLVSAGTSSIWNGWGANYSASTSLVFRQFNFTMVRV